MCGIAGFNIADGDFGKINSQALAKHLLLSIEERGTDATGGAWSQKDKDNLAIWYAKQNVKASTFQSYLPSYIPKRSRNVILHTRYATQGDPKVSDNNHPIVVPLVVGVHNGHISNDKELIRDLNVDRIGQVDSEAAFHLIGSNLDKPQDVLGDLRGRAALGWFRTDKPRELHLARCTGSPLAIGQTKAGSLIFASTMSLLHKACTASKIKIDWEYDVPEWSYLKFRNGVMVEMEEIAHSYQPLFYKPQSSSLYHLY
jgi:glucosamine 6-phosphate synthetase-like amidotransferase/phosphosugar isomerase protein